MIRQEKNLRFKAVITSLADNVRSGNNFSDGLMQHPKVFDRLFVNMVKAGEAGGVLDVVLSRLAKFMEKTVKTNKKIKSAMMYPTVVVCVACGIVFLLMSFVVPKFEQIFNDMLKGKALPGLTLAVIKVSKIITPSSLTSGLIDVAIIVGTFVGIRMFLRTKFGSNLMDIVILRTP